MKPTLADQMNKIKKSLAKSEENKKARVFIEKLKTIKKALDVLAGKSVKKEQDERLTRIMEQVMSEFNDGKLKDSAGNKVVDREQAAAIAYSKYEEGKD